MTYETYRLRYLLFLDKSFELLLIIHNMWREQVQNKNRRYLSKIILYKLLYYYYTLLIPVFNFWNIRRDQVSVFTGKTLKKQLRFATDNRISCHRTTRAKQYRITGAMVRSIWV